MLSRLETMSQAHERERRELEAQLEAQVSAISYSGYCVELLKKEERAAQGGQGMHDVYRQIAARVDNTLTTELAGFYRARSLAHQRQWVRLFDSQAQEREREWHFCSTVSRDMFGVLAMSDLGMSSSGFAASISEQIQGMNESLRVALPPGILDTLATLTSHREVLERFRRRKSEPPATREEMESALQREALRCYGENERCTLKDACALQRARVEAEWQAYAAQVEADYLDQKAALEGRAQAGHKQHGRRPSLERKAGPWKSAEKQSRLIHTAPVLTPETFGGGRRTQPAVRRSSTHNALERERAALQEAFEASKKQMEQQKTMALRWIERQTARMNAHLEQLEKDKQLILSHLEREDLERFVMSEWVDAFVRSAIQVEER
jgi:hypothetical protein